MISVRQQNPVKFMNKNYTETSRAEKKKIGEG